MSFLVKSILYLFIFSLLHFGYEWTHFSFLVPFCGTNESIFQHLKIGFWAYFLASGIEVSVKQNRRLQSGFWYSRLFSSVVLPWFIFLFWYMAPALFGKIHRMEMELAWAILVTWICGVLAGVFERSLEKHSFSLFMKIGILVLFLFSALLYVRFTYVTPWIDLFENPKG